MCFIFQFLYFDSSIFPLLLHSSITIIAICVMLLCHFNGIKKMISNLLDFNGFQKKKKFLKIKNKKVNWKRRTSRSPNTVNLVLKYCYLSVFINLRAQCARFDRRIYQCLKDKY